MSLEQEISRVARILYNTGKKVEAISWQSTTAPKPFLEALMVSFKTALPEDKEDLIRLVKPNLPWAEDHFMERVSGKPLNPPPSHEKWPFAKANNNQFTKTYGGKFSHSYPERFWPKHAYDPENMPPNKINRGIRFEYGDFSNVVNLLIRDPNTRQAYLPIFFPEDTGSVENQRIPCTLGYQFIIREGYIHIIYNMRSCDLLRHFRDDIYMAARLVYHLQGLLFPNLGILEPGMFMMNIGSLHVFYDEKPLLKKYL